MLCAIKAKLGLQEGRDLPVLGMVLHSEGWQRGRRMIFQGSRRVSHSGTVGAAEREVFRTAWIGHGRAVWDRNAFTRECLTAQSSRNTIPAWLLGSPGLVNVCDGS